MANQINVEILDTPLTRSLGIAGHKGYVEKYDGASAYVVVFDLDGGLCGPFYLNTIDFLTEEQARVARALESPSGAERGEG